MILYHLSHQGSPRNRQSTHKWLCCCCSSCYYSWLSIFLPQSPFIYYFLGLETFSKIFMWLAPLHLWVISEAFPDHTLKNSPTLSARLLPSIPALFLYLKYSTFWHFKYYCYVFFFLSLFRTWAPQRHGFYIPRDIKHDWQVHALNYLLNATVLIILRWLFRNFFLFYMGANCDIKRMWPTYLNASFNALDEGERGEWKSSLKTQHPKKLRSWHLVPLLYGK